MTWTSFKPCVIKSFFPSISLESNECDICQFARQTRLPFVNPMSTSVECFELIHSDLWGPSPIDLYDGYKYFMLFIDDRSRAT